jgi:hypothetical protein
MYFATVDPIALAQVNGPLLHHVQVEISENADLPASALH